MKHFLPGKGYTALQVRRILVGMWLCGDDVNVERQAETERTEWMRCQAGTEVMLAQGRGHGAGGAPEAAAARRCWMLTPSMR